MKYITPRNNYNGFLDNAFDDLFQPFYGRGVGSMKTDVSENEEGYQFEIDLPGFKKDEINIDLDKGYLTISANRKEEVNEENKKGYLFRERKFGSMSRTFYVGEVNEENIKANFADGILSIDVPKKEKIESRKKISIE